MSKVLAKRASAALIAVAAVLATACGQLRPPAGKELPRGVMSAMRACRLVVGHKPRGFFTHIERVHLALTTYAKGEPVESRGDISAGMPPHTLVWVVEVHAKKVNWDHSVPPGARIVPGTDFSVVMNARTGYASDAGEGNGWPLPLWKLGPVVSLPAQC